MKFYRLQTTDFTTMQGWRSFYSEFCSLEESMQADIDRWLENGEDVEELDTVEETFNNAIESGLEKRYTEFGVSCYDNIEDLIKYWDYVGFSYDQYFTVKNAFIIVFEGNYTGKGKDDEDTAEFLEEIERISLVDFFKDNIDIMMDVYCIDEEDLKEVM